MIGNTNTRKIHLEDCSAIRMINPEHKVNITSDIEAEQYSPCGWCHGPEAKILSLIPATEKIEPCTDPLLRQRMIDKGCSCGGHIGNVQMYPHPGGILVAGRPGTWWVFFKCYDCGQTSSFQWLPETFAHKLLKEGDIFGGKTTKPCHL